MFGQLKNDENNNGDPWDQLAKELKPFRTKVQRALGEIPVGDLLTGKDQSQAVEGYSLVDIVVGAGNPQAGQRLLTKDRERNYRNWLNGAGKSVALRLGWTLRDWERFRSQELAKLDKRQPQAKKTKALLNLSRAELLAQRITEKLNVLAQSKS